jgi:DNA-binding IclR family transcriptional regulator
MSDEAAASVIARAAQLLDAFGLDDGAVGLSELARRTGLAKPTVHRLCTQLVEERLLERAGAGYLLGSKLFELGQRVPFHRLLREAALPYLEDLYVATRSTVHLAVPDGVEVLYLEKLAGHTPAPPPSRVAGRAPMHCTATGKAILAHSPPELVRRVLDAGLARRTSFTIVVPDVLLDQLAQVRTDGVAFELEETLAGYASVGAPVLGEHGQALGALSVTGPASRVQLERLAPVVRSAARALASALASRSLAALERTGDGRPARW